MDIIACGSRPSRRMGAPSFTGTVWQDPVIQAPEPARIRSAWVRFEPGARTAWHHHPLGQTLFITSGIGWVQTWGGPRRDIRAGDTVWIPPGEKHWHGAAPRTPMTHRNPGEARWQAGGLAGACHPTKVGWDVGIRTPITASRARCPTVERRPITPGARRRTLQT